MKLNQVHIKIIEAASGAPADTPDGTSLEEKVAEWLASRTEPELIDLQYMVDSGGYSVLIMYGQ